MRGPETKATLAHCPAHAEFVGIVLKCGAFMPHLPLGDLTDGAVTLPEATNTRSGCMAPAWQFPTYDNADTFIERLARDGALGFDPVVEAELQGQPQRPVTALRSSGVSCARPD